MNAIMNEKGRQTKLLAAIAVIAMVVCALAVVMPSADAAGENYLAIGDVPAKGTAGVLYIEEAAEGAEQAPQVQF